MLHQVQTVAAAIYLIACASQQTELEPHQDFNMNKSAYRARATSMPLPYSAQHSQDSFWTPLKRQIHMHAVPLHAYVFAVQRLGLSMKPTLVLCDTYHSLTTCH